MNALGTAKRAWVEQRGQAGALGGFAMVEDVNAQGAAARARVEQLGYLVDADLGALKADVAAIRADYVTSQGLSRLAMETWVAPNILITS